MTISCSLGPQLKDEVLSVDVKVLLNTEVLKSVRSTPTLWGNVHTLLVVVAIVTPLLPL